MTHFCALSIQRIGIRATKVASIGRRRVGVASARLDDARRLRPRAPINLAPSFDIENNTFSYRRKYMTGRVFTSKAYFDGRVA
jgi:hypothetical protein